MQWIPIGVWIGAVVLAVVVLGFCGYELVWKTRRLQADLASLRDLDARTREVRAGLAQAQTRLRAAQQVRTTGSG